jgi:uncharacterized membrane protein YhaH (DUF805 family)
MEGNMQLIDAWKKVVLERYAVFGGRARRAEYWWYILAQFIIVAVLAVLMGLSSVFSVLYVVFVIATFIPSIAVAIRRLHDTSRSGWWFLISLVPIVGGIILIVLLALDSTPGPNEYGPSEKDPAGVPVPT